MADEAQDYVDPDLILAIRDIESSGGLNSRESDAGAIGEMQIMPAHFENLRKQGLIGSDTDIYNPDDNVAAGIATYRDERKRFGGDEALALAAYNAGSPAVNNAIKEARARGIGEDFESLKNAELLPYETRQYVGNVLDSYVSRKNARLDQSAENYKSEDDLDYTQWGTPAEFKTSVEDLVTREEFEGLSPQAQVQTISRLYDSRKWLPQVENQFKSVSQAIWKPGDSYISDTPDIAPIANPYLALVEGDTPEKLQESAATAKAKLSSALKKQGVSPAVFGNLIDDAFDAKVKQQEINNRGLLGDAKAYAGAFGHAVVALPLMAGAGAANALGYEDAADSIRNYNYFDPHEEFQFEHDENGNVQVGDDGKPITKWQGTLINTAGGVLGAIGAGAALAVGGTAAAGAAGLSAGGAAAAGSVTALLGLGGINTLANADAAYELAQSEGFDRETASEAALWTLGPSAVDTIANYLTLGLGRPWLQALSGANKVKAVAKLAPRVAAYTARSAALGAASGGAQQAGVEYGVQFASGGQYQADTGNIAVATAAGGLIGAGFGFHEGYNSPNPPRPKVPVAAWDGRVIEHYPTALPAPKERLGLPAPEPRLALPAPPDPEGPRGLPPPPNRQSGEAIFMPHTASPEEQIKLVKLFEAFQNDTDKNTLVRYTDPEGIPEDLLTLFGYKSDKVSDGEVLITKQESYVPPEVDELGPIEDHIGYLMHDLQNSPDLEEIPKLLQQRKRLVEQQRELFPSINDKKVRAEAAENIRERARLNETEAKLKSQLRKTEDPVLRSILNDELDLNTALKRDLRSKNSEAFKHAEKIERINSRLEKLNDPWYANNRIAKQRALEDLLIKRAGLSAEPVTPVPKTSGEKIGEPVTKPTIGGERAEVTDAFKSHAVTVKTKDGTFHLLPLNKKWYAIGENGEVLTSGHTLYKDAYTAGKQTRIPQKIEVEPVVRGEVAKAVPPLKFVERKTIKFGDSNYEQVNSKHDSRTAKPKPKGKSKSGKKRRDTKTANRREVGRNSEVGEGTDSTNNVDRSSFGRTVSRSDDTGDAAGDSSRPRAAKGPKESGAAKEQASGNTKSKVKVAPIPYDNKPILGSNELNRLAEKVFERPAIFGGKFKKLSDPKKIIAGNYSSESQQVRVRFHGDIDTTAHELSHSLSDRLKLGDLKKINAHPRAEQIKAEAIDLGPGGSGGPGQTEQYNVEEGVAEYIRSHSINPDATEKNYPALTDYYKKNVPEEQRKAITTYGNEVRRRAGAPATKQVDAHVAHTPNQDKLTSREKVDQFFNGDTNKKFSLSGLDKLRKLLVNDKYARTKAFEFVTRKKEESLGRNLIGDERPETLARLYSDIKNTTADIIQFGQRRFGAGRDERLNDGLSWLMGDFDTTSEEAFNTDRDLTENLLVAQTTIEDAQKTPKSLENAVGIVSGIAGGQGADIDVARQFMKEFNALPEDKKARITESARRFREWAHNDIDYAVDAGYFTEAEGERLKSSREYYAPLQRVMDDPELRKNFIELRKGSGRKIVGPYDSLMENTTIMRQIVDRNRYLDLFTDYLTTGREMYSDEESFGDIGHKVGAERKDEKGITIVKKNGETTYWKFDEDLKEALSAYSKSNMLGPVSAMFRGMTQLLKAGVSFTPAFALRNHARDFRGRLITSDVGIGKQTVESVRTTKHALNLLKPGALDQEASDLNYYGGSQKGIDLRERHDFHEYQRQVARELTGKNDFIFDPRRVLRGYVKNIQKSEESGRIAEFHSQMQKLEAENPGLPFHTIATEAAFKARDTMDFRVAGTLFRELENFLPYISARVRGIEKLARTFKEKPAQTFTRMVLTVGLPAIAMRLYNQSQGKEEEYDQLPDYRKYTYGNWSVGNNTWALTPIPFEGAIFNELVDRSFDQAKGKENAFDGFEWSALRAALPFDGGFPVVLRPTYEVLSNYDSFRQKEINSPFTQNLSLENRDPEPASASRLGSIVQNTVMNIGNAVFGGTSSSVDKLFNANAVDHQLRGYLGNSGALLTSASDIGRENGGKPLTWESMSGVIQDTPISSMRNVQTVMDFARANGISVQNRRIKPLRDAMAEYYQADEAGKQAAIDKVMRISTELVKGQKSQGKDFYGKKKKDY